MRPRHPQPPKPSAFAQSGDLLARSSAVGLTFFGTGPAFAATQTHIAEFVAEAYSASLVGVATLLWFILVAVVIFAFSTLLVAAVIQIGSFKGGTKLFKSH